MFEGLSFSGKPSAKRDVSPKSEAPSALAFQDTQADLLDDQEKSVLKDISGEDAAPAQVGAYWDMVKNPHAGSIIYAAGKCNNSKLLGRYAVDKLLPNILAAFASDDAPMMLYLVLHLALPHNESIHEAEVIKKDLPGKSDEELVSIVTGIPLEKRSDLQKVLKKVAVYHPSLVNRLKDLMTRFSYK